VQIAILNQSTLVTNDEVAAMTEAIAAQVSDDAAAAWDRPAAQVAFFTDASAVPAQMHRISMVDTIKDGPAGVLGYHTESAGGILWGIVAAKPELDNGGKVLTGDWSVSSVLSHEVLEMYVDPYCNLWANNDGGSVYSFEVCDPVEAPTYEVGGVSVSNFVTPAWFDPLSVGAGAAPSPAGTVNFDHLGLLKAPFTIVKGGYVVYSTAGKAQQKFGDEFPQWRRDMKSGVMSRTRCRLRQLTGPGA
jgi:hypothetical protein